MGEINFSNPRKLVLNSYYPEIYDPANLKFKELELEDSVIEDSETAFKLDFSKDVEVGTEDVELAESIE